MVFRGIRVMTGFNTSREKFVCFRADRFSMKESTFNALPQVVGKILEIQSDF